MKFRTIFLAAFVLFLFSNSALSQRPILPRPVVTQNEGASQFFKIGEITGNLGGAKALHLAKPVYPADAREAGAEGKVKVEIEIEPGGNVISARAVSGNPALHEAAQNAALASRFSVPKTGGQGAKVSGSLNYNFIVETPNWFKVGYDVALIGKASSLAYFQGAVIKKLFQPDWKTELEQIAQLQEIRRAEKKELDGFEQPVVSGTLGRTSGSQTLQMRLPIPTQNPQKFVIAQNLNASLEARLGADAVNLWKFHLGAAFIKAQEVSRNPNTRGAAGEILRAHLERAPEGVSAEFLAPLEDLIEGIENKAFIDVRTEMGITVAKLQKIKSP